MVNVSSPMRVEGDGVFYYSWLRSTVFDLDFDFYNELQHFSSYDIGSRNILKDGLTTGIGKVINPYAYGTGLMWLPLYIIAHLLSMVFLLPLDGYSYLYVISINLSSWIFGALAVIILYNILRRFFSDMVSFLSTLGIYLATPWFYYQFLEPSMSHMASLFTVSLFLCLIVRLYQKEKINLYLLALVVFLMLSIRWQNLLYGVAFLPVLWQYKNNLKLVLKMIVAGLVPIIIFWASQAMIWKHLYGQYFLQPQGKYFVRPEFHGLYILFSSNRGLLLWSPIIIFAFLGFYYLYKKSKFLFVVAILAFVSQWILNGSLNDLGGGDAYGARRFIETLPFLALALGAYLEKVKFKKITIITIIILILWNIILIEYYRQGIIPHHGEFIL